MDETKYGKYIVRKLFIIALILRASVVMAEQDPSSVMAAGNDDRYGFTAGPYGKQADTPTGKSNSGKDCCQCCHGWCSYLETYASLNPGSMSCILVVPPHAKALADEGWTKKGIKEYILKNSDSPFPRARDDRGTPILPVDSSIDNLMILVAGGPGAWIGLMRSAGGWNNSFVTMKIDLPRNWDKLVEKYKNIVPVYVGY